MPGPTPNQLNQNLGVGWGWGKGSGAQVWFFLKVLPAPVENYWVQGVSQCLVSEKCWNPEHHPQTKGSSLHGDLFTKAGS